MTRRIVRLLDRTPLTPRQIAQRKYRASAKGKAADARSKVKERLKPGYQAKVYVRVKRWRHANALQYRVYNRVCRCTRRRLLRERQSIGAQ